MKTHQHRTNAWIPEPIAKALSVQPDLIQKAVEGFYVRDPAQLRVCPATALARQEMKRTALTRRLRLE